MYVHGNAYRVFDARVRVRLVTSIGWWMFNHIDDLAKKIWKFEPYCFILAWIILSNNDTAKQLGILVIPPPQLIWWGSLVLNTREPLTKHIPKSAKLAKGNGYWVIMPVKRMF